MSQRPEQSAMFDEGRLRRALRLDANELPARLDAAAIAARAEDTRTDRRVAALASAAVAGAAAAILLGVAVATASALAPTLLTDAYGTLMDLVASGAVIAELALERLQDPTLPMTVLAGLAVAVVYEYLQRRELADVLHTS